jgi:hypothetical protein
MKKKYIFVFISILVLLILIISQNDKTKSPEIIDEVIKEFSNEQKVNIIGYDGDAMEPYISRDEKYLFFNNDKGENDKDLYWAEKINNLNFQYRGEVKGVNTPDVDGNPTMDSENNFYFITTRDLDNDNWNSIYVGTFKNGTVEDLRKINGTINGDKKMWLNMGVEISKDGTTMYTSYAHFKTGSNFPVEGDIRFAKKEGNEFNIPKNETEILKNINTDYAIEYAGEISEDGLELLYSQVTLTKPPLFKLYYSKRNKICEPFGIPKYIEEPFIRNKNAFVEAPTLSPDGKRLYYHKLDDDKFSIFMLSRK